MIASFTCGGDMPVTAWSRRSAIAGIAFCRSFDGLHSSRGLSDGILRPGRPPPRSQIVPPRILVLSASVGAGHLRAAQAVELALRRLVPDAVVRNVDVLDLTNAAFRQLYGKAYLDLVNKAPHVLGFFYDMLDKPSRSGKNRSDKFRLAVEKLNLREFIRFLEAEPWDLVINTHFLPAEIIASLRKHD